MGVFLFPMFSNPTQRACFLFIFSFLYFSQIQDLNIRDFSLWILPYQKSPLQSPQREPGAPALHERDGTAAAAGACEAAAGGGLQAKPHLGVKRLHLSGERVRPGFPRTSPQPHH